MEGSSGPSHSACYIITRDRVSCSDSRRASRNIIREKNARVITAVSEI